MIMSNMLDYLKWRGDIDMAYYPFNEVDAMVFARLAYIPFDKILLPYFDEGISLKVAIETLLKDDNLKDIITNKDDIELLKILSTCLRYLSFKASAYIDEVSDALEKQFAALCLKRENDYYILYRGTDLSIAGIKEDFNMSYMENVPSQLSAKDYYIKALKAYGGNFTLIGHSKGGNLAVFTAAMVDDEYKRYIKAIYNFDGPGFSEDFILGESYKAISDRVYNIIPETSIIGTLLEQASIFKIAKSNSKGISQHNLYSWQVERDSIVSLEELSRVSKVFDETIKEWTSAMDEIERKKFVDIIYSIIQNMSKENDEGFDNFDFKRIDRAISSWNNIDDENKEYFSDNIKSFIKIFLKKAFLSKKD